MKYIFLMFISAIGLYFSSFNLFAYVVDKSLWIGNNEQIWLFMINSILFTVTVFYLIYGGFFMVSTAIRRY